MEEGMEEYELDGDGREETDRCALSINMSTKSGFHLLKRDL
jgi:hypothetical protein